LRGNYKMPTTLGRRFSIDWRGTPPHMLASDVPVWYRFLDLYGGQIINLFYDCFLGGPYLSPEEEKDSMKRMWRATTSKRTDAIAETASEVWLIEVSNYPGMRALGQLLTYQALWLEDPKIAKIERLVLVCEQLDNDLAAGLGKLGVLLYIV